MDFLEIVIYFSVYLGLFAATFYIISYWADKKKERQFYSDDELPKVTVIIPAWNEEKSIKKTIDSVETSDYPDFEVLVVDDGSTDNTYEIAKQLEKEYDNLRVFAKEVNGGKGSALNYGIEKAEGEIIFTMDADTSVEPRSMKNMTRYFKEPKIMSVTPAMIIDKPKTIWQRVQAIEYLLGLFLRKAFASLDAIYITPGAFSAYRKSFFDKHGGYDEGNVTEDLEIALRIQYKGYLTQNSPDAPAYTIAPPKFKQLLIQRRRWYYGLIQNSLKYKKIFSRKYGDLGSFVFPLAWINIFLAIFITSFLFIKTLLKVKNELLFLQNVNFDFFNLANLNFYLVERALFLVFTNPVIIFLIVFILVAGFYIYYASKKVGKPANLVLNLSLFFIFFAILFGFWWVVSFGYALFGRRIKWR